MIGDAMTPFYPRFSFFLSKLNLKLPSVFVEIKCVEVKFFKFHAKTQFKAQISNIIAMQC